MESYHTLIGCGHWGPNDVRVCSQLKGSRGRLAQAKPQQNSHRTESESFTCPKLFCALTRPLSQLANGLDPTARSPYKHRRPRRRQSHFSFRPSTFNFQPSTTPVALALECSDEYMRCRTCLSLQGRELQEAGSGPRPKTGGTSHAVGCRFTDHPGLAPLEIRTVIHKSLFRVHRAPTPTSVVPPA
jgi:hypothetical protein